MQAACPEASHSLRPALAVQFIFLFHCVVRPIYVKYVEQGQGFSLESSQFQLVGNLGGDLLESDGRAGDALEPDPVEGEAWQLAHLNLPLNQSVGVGVTVNTQQEETLSLLVITIVCIQNLKGNKRRLFLDPPWQNFNFK